MLKVFLPKHFMIILKRGKENMFPYYIFGSMEMCSREVEVGAFYLLGGLKHLIHRLNDIENLLPYFAL